MLQKEWPRVKNVKKKKKGNRIKKYKVLISESIK